MNYYNTIHTADYEQYVVKPGDSLYMIAKKYNVSIEDLKNINHLVSNIIYPNQILFIPKNKICNSTTGSVVTTGHNESVNDLINKYSVTLNDISNLKVMSNQELVVRDKKYYTIMVGDTLEEILMKFELTPTEFLKLNKEKFIIPGEKIIIDK